MPVARERRKRVAISARTGGVIYSLFPLMFSEFSSDYNQPGNGFLREDTILQNIIISFQEENYERGSGLEIKSACCVCTRT